MTIENGSMDSSEIMNGGIDFDELDRAIEDAVHNKNWFGRVARGYDAFGEQKGRCAETTAIVSSFVATLLVGGVVFTSVWGAYVMFKDAVIYLNNGERPAADVGHAGEWSAQVLIYMYFYFRQLHKVAAEGDHHQVNKIFMNTFKNLEISSDDLPAAYHYVLQTTKSLTRGGVIHRSLFTNTARSIELVADCAKKDDLEAPLEVDNLSRVKDIFDEIQRDLDRVLGTRNFFRRSWEGVKSIHRSHGKTGVIAAAVTGVALPLLLGFQSALSVIGTAFVIDDFANHDEEISVIGHVGEWPVNALAFAYMAYKLNEWSITSEGDLVLAKEVIQSHLNTHSGELEESFRNLFIQTGNDELHHLASKCMFTSVPSTYLLKENNA